MALDAKKSEIDFPLKTDVWFRYYRGTKLKAQRLKIVPTIQ